MSVGRASNITEVFGSVVHQKPDYFCGAIAAQHATGSYTNHIVLKLTASVEVHAPSLLNNSACKANVTS
jgi:hypothetical protein